MRNWQRLKKASDWGHGYECWTCKKRWYRWSNIIPMTMTSLSCPLCDKDYGTWDWFYLDKDEFIEFALNAKRARFYGRPR